jgi:hypothetical protein
MSLNPTDARRRWFGLFFLLVAGGMLLWGQTILKKHLEGMGFIIYWLVCLGFTGLAMVTALIDDRVLRRRTRDQHRDLIYRAIDEIEDKKDKPGRSNR